MRYRLICVAALLSGCVADRPASDLPADTARPTAQTSHIEPVTAADSAAAHPTVALLRNVRAASHDGHDRVVFEFDGPMPPYSVSYTDLPVTECGSGKSVELPGTALLVARFSPANAHTEAGEASGAPRALPAAGSNILQLRQVCDFEAVVQWVVALKRAQRYTVSELANPTRLIVDLEN